MVWYGSSAHGMAGQGMAIRHLTFFFSNKGMGERGGGGGGWVEGNPGNWEFGYRE